MITSIPIQSPVQVLEEDKPKQSTDPLVLVRRRSRKQQPKTSIRGSWIRRGNRLIPLVQKIRQRWNGQKSQWMESRLVQIVVTQIPSEGLSEMQIRLARLLGGGRHDEQRWGAKPGLSGWTGGWMDGWIQRTGFHFLTPPPPFHPK